MFNGLYKRYSRKFPVIEKDKYNQNIETYSDGEDVEMFISLMTHYDNTANDMRIKDCTHVALTLDNTVSVNDLIDGNLKVNFINSSGREIIVYLKEVDNDGNFSQ